MKKLIYLLFLGALIRFLFIPQPGFAADIAFWKSWSLAAAQKGLVWTTLETNYNYAPAFLYFLKGVGWLYQLFADPNNFNQYWQETNLLFLLIIKLPVIIADLFTAWGIWSLLKEKKTFKKIKLGRWQLAVPLVAAGFYLFNPFIIFNGAWWGQVGSIGTSLILLSLILLFKQKPLWAIALATLAFLLKLQMMFYLPLVLLWVFKKFGWQKLVACLATTTGVFFLISLPFVLANQMEKVTNLIFSSASYFPLLSLNAYNPWWLFAKGAGFTTSDRVLVFGLTSANFLGLFTFFVFYLLALILLWQKTEKTTLFKSGLWIAFAFFMLPTQMHERYLYPAFMFMALLIPKVIQLYQQKKSSFKTWLYLSLLIVLPLSGFYNLHNVLIDNYPANGLAFLAKLNLTWLTLLVAAVHTLLFLGLSLIYFSAIKPRWRWSILSLAVFFLVIKQASFSLAKEISLVKIAPIWQQQDYAIPMKNLTVYSAWGIKRWAFLSNNYYFYRHGLATHANSKLIYPLKGQFKRFSVDIGVDSEAGANASVIFQIMGDDQLLYTSTKMGKFDFPKHIEVDINNIKNLALIVNDADDGITSDQADWLNPRLYK